MGEGLVTVEVEGWEQALEALRAFEPRLRAAVIGDLQAVLREAASEASARIRRVSGESAAGYQVSTTRRGVALVNRARGAAIAEFAGKVHPQGRTPRGRTLIRTLNARYGTPGRLAWAAVDRRRARVEAATRATVAAIEREIQGRGLA